MKKLDEKKKKLAGKMSFVKKLDSDGYQGDIEKSFKEHGKKK